MRSNDNRFLERSCRIDKRSLYITSYTRKSTGSISIRIICHRHDDDLASATSGMIPFFLLLHVPKFSQYYFIDRRGQRRDYTAQSLYKNKYFFYYYFLWWTQRLRHRRPSSLYNSFLLIYLLLYRKKRRAAIVLLYNLIPIKQSPLIDSLQGCQTFWHERCSILRMYRE